MPRSCRLRVGIALLAGLAVGGVAALGAGEGSVASGQGGRAAPVIVLVHGFQGFGGGPEYTCRAAPLAYPEETGDFDRLAARAHAAGARVFVARYTSNARETDSLEASARCLGRQIAAVKERLDVRKVALAGHSLGGIVSRRYVEGPEYGGDVSALVTYGAPHEGIPNAARLLAMLYPLPYGLDCGRHPGACELFPERMARFNGRFRPSDSVDYRLVGGTRGWLTSWFIGGADDGLVATSSAVAGRLGYAPHSRSRVYDAHSDFGGWVTDHYVSSVESSDCLLWAVGLRSGPGSCAPTGAATLAAEVDEATAFTPTAVRSLDASATEELSLLVDGQHAQVLVSWIGVSPTLTLSGPDGVPRNPDVLASRPAHTPWQPALSALAGQAVPAAAAAAVGAGGLALFDLASPVAGRWRLLARAADAPTQVQAFAALASDTRLEVAPFGPAAPGDTVGMMATVTGSACVDGGCVLGALLPFELSAARATATEIGPGAFRLDIMAPERPGLHLIAVRAAGQAPDGAAFEREIHVVLEVLPVKAGVVYLPVGARP